MTKTFTSIIVGIPKTITASDLQTSDTGITELYIAVKNSTGYVSITVEKLLQKPTDVGTDVSGRVYRYIKITKENLVDENLDRPKIKFKIEKSWINANNIGVTTIALYRYSSGAWNKLTTTKLSEDNTYVYFEAETPGFSYFAISGQALTTTTTPTATTTRTTTTTTTSRPSLSIPSTPGIIAMGIVLIMIVLIAIILISRKPILPSTKPVSSSGQNRA
jgi:PGF-pre-PGF domain-containing protein